MTSDLVSVIIANWNSAAFIERCLESMLRQTHANIEFIIVDNASSDDSPARIRAMIPDATFIQNADNAGFARAQNQGMAAARGVFVMPLNFDTMFEPEYVAGLVDVLQRRPEAGSACGKLFKMTREFETTDILDSTGHVMKNRDPGRRGRGERDTGQFESEERVFGSPGTAPLFRKSAIDHARVFGEVFDESFYMYLEDIDLDWRLNLYGYEAVYVPGAVGYHAESGTISDDNRWIQWLATVNYRLMLLKNDRLSVALAKMPTMARRALFPFQLRAGRPVTDVYRYWRLLPLTMRKRAEIQNNSRVSPDEIEKMFF